MTKRILLISLAAIVCAVSCVNAPTMTQTSFETLTISEQNLDVPVSYSATIAGISDVIILPQVSGQLMKMCVEEGNKVHKGQVLFLIDNRQAKLALNAAKADLLAAEALCNSAQLEYESNQNLFDKKIVSSYMLNTSLNEYNRAKAAVEQAKAAVANAELQLEFCTISAPSNGIVGNIPIRVGDLVSPERPLTTVSSNTEVKAYISIPETVLEELVSGAGSIDSLLTKVPEATLILKDGTEYQHKGKIVSISGIVDKATGSVKCSFSFPNPDGMLFSGIQGSVRMINTYEAVRLIPLTSVVRIQDKTLVYKVVDNCASSTVVELIEVGDGKNAAVVSGLENGDVIVAKGINNVVDGQQVIFPETTDKK